MLEIRNTEVHGLDRACVASGNPMTVGEIDTTDRAGTSGEIVLTRCRKLGGAKAGSGHDNFLSGILVQFDLKYSMYFTSEFQRYHFVQIISSQSKMHRLIIAASNDSFHAMFNKYVDYDIIEKVRLYATGYNNWMELGDRDKAYDCFMKTLSNLPAGYEMWETISTNYLALKTIYNQRKNHRLKEDWGAFCTWCEGLPMFAELVGVARH